MRGIGLAHSEKKKRAGKKHRMKNERLNQKKIRDQIIKDTENRLAIAWKKRETERINKERALVHESKENLAKQDEFWQKHIAEDKIAKQKRSKHRARIT